MEDLSCEALKTTKNLKKELGLKIKPLRTTSVFNKTTYDISTKKIEKTPEKPVNTQTLQQSLFDLRQTPYDHCSKSSKCSISFSPITFRDKKPTNTK